LLFVKKGEIMRKTRTDSISGQIKAIQASSKGIQPPAHITLRPEDRPFWRSILKARAVDTWNDSDLEVAAELAATRADIKAIRDLIAVQGHVIDGKVNVLHPLLEQLVRRQTSLSRVLGVHAAGAVGRGRDLASRTMKQRQFTEKIENALSDDEDNLLAKPYWLDNPLTT
jgi:hypothetical protein